MASVEAHENTSKTTFAHSLKVILGVHVALVELRSTPLMVVADPLRGAIGDSSVSRQIG